MKPKWGEKTAVREKAATLGEGEKILLTLGDISINWTRNELGGGAEKPEKGSERVLCFPGTHPEGRTCRRGGFGEKFLKLR